MADQKITDLTADASPSLDDLVVSVNDPGGTPANRKVTFQSVLDLFEANGAAPSTFISSGTMADARISESSVTQHEAALSITESQISDLGTYQAQLSEGAFADGDKTKLDGIEASADVTDETNVVAALDGATLSDIGTPASSDRILVQDASDSNNLKYALFSTFGTALGDPGADRLVFWDDSAGSSAYLSLDTGLSISGTTMSVDTSSVTETLTNKTIDGDNNTISNLDLGNEVEWATITDLTDRTAFASGDKLMIFEAGVGMRRIDYDDLPGAGGGLSNIVEDTTPQLGGDLDLNGNDITGMVIGTDIQAYDANLPTWPATVDATEVGYLNGVTSAIQTQIDGKIADVVDDTTPQLGGDLDGQGNEIANFVNSVVTSVSGTLTTTAHSGNVIKTSGNVTVPTTAGFTCTIIAGGAHTVTFNATTSAAMATGDVMTVVVESSTVIHAVLTAAADKVSFS